MATGAKDGKVILVSGGLDSYVAYRIAPEPKVALWIDLGQPYAKKEEEAIDRLGIKVVKRKADVLPEKPTVDDWIIPGRNLLLATIAAMYGGEIWLSALDGEMHKFARERDKSPEFYHLASGLLTYVFDIMRDETRVVTPFALLTKSEMVAEALKNGITKEELVKTSSCYHDTLRNCGLCGTCFKRWIAMKNNGIDEKYENDPTKNEYAIRTTKEMFIAWERKDFKHYTKKRCEETFKALELPNR